MTVIDQGMGGNPDARIAALCRAEGRTLLTLDVGFADRRAFPPSEHNGLIVLRLRRQDKGSVISTVGRVVRLLGTERIDGCLWIVEEDRVRVRD